MNAVLICGRYRRTVNGFGRGVDVRWTTSYRRWSTITKRTFPRCVREPSSRTSTTRSSTRNSFAPSRRQQPVCAPGSSTSWNSTRSSARYAHCRQSSLQAVFRTRGIVQSLRPKSNRNSKHHFFCICSSTNINTWSYLISAVRSIVQEMVRDNFLTLPEWSTRDDINDIIFSICVSWTVCYMCPVCFLLFFSVFICIVCYVSVYLVLRVRF